MSSELHPIIPREENQQAALSIASQQDAPEPVPITEQEVGEYREQDRFLPVRILTLERVVFCLLNLSCSR
jgi:hypothetical protein